MECEGTNKTIAFTGVEALHIKSRTMHSARDLSLSGPSRRDQASAEMKMRYERVALVIEDESSMINQALLGSTDIALRGLTTNNHQFMGGKHVLLADDWFQIPPAGGVPWEFI